jgi:hypothetical protein
MLYLTSNHSNPDLIVMFSTMIGSLGIPSEAFCAHLLPLPIFDRRITIFTPGSAAELVHEARSVVYEDCC